MVHQYLIASTKINDRRCCTYCPIFYKSLREWMQDDMEMIDFIKRMMGYFLTGLTNEQCMFIFVGNGANGKSVLLDVFAEL